jgi:hypothetical protein
VSGAIQFSNGSAFASDAANFFWDDTNKRLGVNTNAPTTALQINYSSSTLNGLLINQTGSTGNFSNIGFANGGTIRSTFGMNLNTGEVRWFNAVGGYFATIYGGGSEAMRIDASRNVGIGTASASARTHIVGSGSTSATTALLVQNSAGSTTLRVSDNGSVSMGDTTASGGIGTFEFYQFYRFLSAGASVAGCYKSFQAFSVDGTRMCINVASGSHSESASFQIDSTTRGMLMPRMTTTQINAIASPANGLEVYNTTLNCPCFYNGTSWRQVTNSAM